MADFILYGTEGCHLCEEAEALLMQVGLDFEKQDIMDDEQALQLYAVRIPVLQHRHSLLELGWPFDIQQLQNSLHSQGTW